MAFLTFASFKPYYNWNAFNTVFEILKNASFEVLNLIITGIPSIPYLLSFKVSCGTVLNLIITGIPSILDAQPLSETHPEVLNLIITGIPSILNCNI